MREIDDPDESLEIEQIEVDSYSGPLVFGGDEVDNTLEAKLKMLDETVPGSDLIKEVEEFKAQIGEEARLEYQKEKKELQENFEKLGKTYSNVFMRGLTARETPETVRERYGDLTVRARGLELGDSLSCWGSLAIGLNIKRKNPTEEQTSYFERATGIQKGQPHQITPESLFIGQSAASQSLDGQSVFFLVAIYNLENNPERLASVKDFISDPSNRQRVIDGQGVIRLAKLLPVFNEWFHQSPLEAK